MEQIGSLIINNNSDGHVATLFPSCVESAHEEKSKQMKAQLTQKTIVNEPGENKTKKKGTPPSPVCSFLAPATLQHYGVSSREELQNSMSQHHHSFLPISISCALPIAASIPTMPPQLKQILSVLRGKSADS